MRTLRIVRLKPNPIGKDKNRYGTAAPAQLGAEWVDYKNTGTAAVDLAGIELYHVAYDAQGNGTWERVQSFMGQVGVGEIVRVHSGETRPLSVLYADDLRGATHHVFTGRDRYVWNNDRSDIARLLDRPTNQEIDRAGYAANPPEGVVLVRSGDSLVVGAAAYSRI